MEDSMQSLEILEYARQLHDVRGEAAILEAAQKASACEAKGNAEEAANWRRIQSALTTLKTPHVS
jgi:hypothetical protein